MKNQYIGGGGGGGGLGSLKRAFDEKEEVVFLMGVDTPMHIMYVEN